jgi:hypothetical protein
VGCEDAKLKDAKTTPEPSALSAAHNAQGSVAAMAVQTKRGYLDARRASRGGGGGSDDEERSGPPVVGDADQATISTISTVQASTLAVDSEDHSERRPDG